MLDQMPVDSFITYMLFAILLLLVAFIGLEIYLFMNKRKDKGQDKLVEETNRLREDVNKSIGDMSSSFNQQFTSLSKDVTRDMTKALTQVDEKVGAFNKQVEDLNKSQASFSKILAGVKKYGTLAEFTLSSLLKDLLPASQYISNVKMKEDTGENVEFAVKLQDGILVPIDSHWPVEKFQAIVDAEESKDKKAIASAKDKLASAFRTKAKNVNEKYIVPPKTTDFAIVYAPTESLFSELTSYRDPSTKELLTQELMRKYKITISGPNTLSAYLQSLHMGFQTLKVQKHATQIYNDLRNISSRFNKHFDGIVSLRKTLEEALNHTDDFGRDARSIMRTLENIKTPEPVEKQKEEANDKVDKVKSFNK
tara:strand:- start:774 stop:1871 length:1098 start_codon:yes stop_codon:yes gene_type:complete